MKVLKEAMDLDNRHDAKPHEICIDEHYRIILSLAEKSPTLAFDGLSTIR